MPGVLVSVPPSCTSIFGTVYVPSAVTRVVVPGAFRQYGLVGLNDRLPVIGELLAQQTNGRQESLGGALADLCGCLKGAKDLSTRGLEGYGRR